MANTCDSVMIDSLMTITKELQQTVLLETSSNNIPNVLIISITSSLMATIIYFLLRQLVRPKIAVFNKIAIRKRIGADNTEEIVSTIKIINKCRFCIEDVSFRVFLIKEASAGDKRNRISKTLELKLDKYFEIPGNGKKSKEHYDNCVLININGDVREQFLGADSNAFLCLQIYATHSKSGFKKVVTKNFNDINVFPFEGYFKSGEQEDFVELKLEK